MTVRRLTLFATMFPVLLAGGLAIAQTGKAPRSLPRPTPAANRGVPMAGAIWRSRW